MVRFHVVGGEAINCRVFARALLASFLIAGAGLTAQVSKAVPQDSPSGSPSQASASDELPAVTADTLVQARALMQAGRVSEAERMTRGYLAEHPNSAEAHFLLGYILFRQHNPKESLGEYTDGAKYQSPRAFEFKIVAFDYVLLRDYSDADKWLTRASAQAPHDVDLWYWLGRARYEENRFADAIAAFEQCLALDPANVKAEDNLGLAYQGLDRNDDAIAAFRAAIKRQQNSILKNPDPYINLGSLLIDLNRPADAVTYLTEAVAIAPEAYAQQGMTELQPRAHEQLGRAYSRLNQLAKAQAELETAVALSPKNAKLHYLLGQLYQKQGLATKAHSEFDTYAALSKAGTSGNSPAAQHSP